MTNVTDTKVVGPASEWEPTNKTISIRETTRKRLQSYGDHYGSTYDSIITQILDEKENKETPNTGAFLLNGQTNYCHNNAGRKTNCRITPKAL